MKAALPLFRFNHGVISPLALARVDVKRVALSAASSVNWVPRVLGSMMLRPGMQWVGIPSSTYGIYIPFIFSTTDIAFIESGQAGVRFWVNEQLLRRGFVATAITNGTFPGSLATWTATGGVTWISAGRVQFLSNGTAVESLYQTVVPSANVEHAVHISVTRGPLTVRIGSTVGGDELFSETTLETGVHSLAFTPTGNFTVWFQSTLDRAILLNSCTIESFTPVILNDSALIASSVAGPQSAVYDQSGNVIYVALNGYQQLHIRRYTADSHSWGVTKYAPTDGPFRTENVTATTITPSAISGNITLTASDNIFKSTNVGSLWSLTSSSQIVSKNIAAANTFTDPIQVAGIGEARRFTYEITNTVWAGTTVTLQRSVGIIGSWEDVSTFTADTTDTLNDGLDNQIIYYRLGIKAGMYGGAGTATCKLTYSNGSITGVVRVTDFTDSTHVGAEVLKALGDTNATDIWAEGAWSDRRGWPSAGCFYEGRLWWSGKNGVWGSVSDAYESFDPNVIGDSGPISRSIGSGPVDTINWMLPLQRLLVGGQGAELSVRSTTFDEPLTPTNFNVKEASTQGSTNVQAKKVDTRGVFVQKSGHRVYQLAFETENFDYGSTDLTALCPEFGLPGIVQIAIQRQPDTRIHCVRSDGTVMLGVVDRVESVLSWQDIETDGIVQSVIVLPGAAEDKVYYVVERMINGSGQIYIERWAMESECVGGALNKQADSFILYSGAAATVIPGLSTLEAKNVIVWGDGKDFSPTDGNGVQTTFLVTGGQITLPVAVSSAVIGLPYTADWEMSKMAGMTQQEGAFSQRRRISQLALIMANVHSDGIRCGPDFDNLDPLPKVQQGKVVPYDTVYPAYDYDLQEFISTWDPDARLCMRAQAPRPATLLAAAMQVEGGNKS